MRKQRDARVVKFNQDYAPGGKVIYANKSTHAIHVNTVQRLQELGVKMTVDKVDFNALHEKIKASRKAKVPA